MNYNTVAETSAVSVPTTDGSMYVLFMEDADGNCDRVAVQIGKSGTAIRAWTHAMMEMANVALSNGVKLSTIAIQLSNIYTDRNVTTATMNNIKSGPDGFVYAINVYLRSKKTAGYVPFDMPWAAGL